MVMATSAYMLQICGDTNCKPLELLFKQALATGVFSSEWKNDNIIPCHKKGDRQNLKIYCPVSLLPICAKKLKDSYLMKCLVFSD